MNAPLLSVEGLTVEFARGKRTVSAVNGVSFELDPGETLGIVGESGSGKTVTVLSILGLVPSPPGRLVAGRALFDGQDLLSLNNEELRRIRGKDIAMVFQDPMTSLNPVIRVGDQIREALWAHDKSQPEDEYKEQAVKLLDAVGTPQPQRRYHQFPHEYSGGMRQRAMIAMAIANRPKLLIADEPTTALDVTIQAQVLDVLMAAKESTGAATILITHDLGLVAEMADRVIVMYAGEVMEHGPKQEIFERPRHPYTAGLLASLPSIEDRRSRLFSIPGRPPDMSRIPSGCPFHPRCAVRGGRSRCVDEHPELRQLESGQLVACHFADEVEEWAQFGEPRLSDDT